MKTMTFLFHTDPGHGWLEVPFQMLQFLNIEDVITAYSYMQGQTCYLEEDQDVMTFVKAVQNHDGPMLEFEDRHTNEDSFVRKLVPYNPLRFSTH